MLLLHERISFSPVTGRVGEILLAGHGRFDGGVVGKGRDVIAAAVLWLMRRSAGGMGLFFLPDEVLDVPEIASASRHTAAESALPIAHER
jgi:hypothetical protein